VFQRPLPQERHHRAQDQEALVTSLSPSLLSADRNIASDANAVVPRIHILKAVREGREGGCLRNIKFIMQA
jgi:hypothetical protein